MVIVRMAREGVFSSRRLLAEEQVSIVKEKIKNKKGGNNC